MRLIDADKLRFRHTVKCNSNTTRPYTLNCISFDEVQNAPTVDVLDKIRAEIDQQEKWLLQAGYTAYNVDIAFDSIKSVLAESEE